MLVRMIVAALNDDLTWTSTQEVAKNTTPRIVEWVSPEVAVWY